MKNILGTTEDLELFDKNVKRVYRFIKDSKGYTYKYTYDSNGNQLTYKDSKGYTYKYTYDSNGNILTHKDSNGYSWQRTYDFKGNILNFKNSDGYCYEYTYDSNGNQLTYKDSTGVTRGFDVPEYTMEELVEKLGNFKIKK